MTQLCEFSVSQIKLALSFKESAAKFTSVKYLNGTFIGGHPVQREESHALQGLCVFAKWWCLLLTELYYEASCCYHLRVPVFACTVVLIFCFIIQPHYIDVINIMNNNDFDKLQLQ